MYSMAANRSMNKLKRELSEEEVAKLKKKIFVIAAIVSVTFAFLYNKIIMVRFMGGIQ